MTDCSQKTPEEDDRLRLVRFIAASAAASRRGAGDLVKAGRVSINGVPCSDPSRRVGSSDIVELDGRRLVAESKRYYMLNKPCGYTCSNFDPHAEKLAVELITQEAPGKLFSAGRLDRESEGLIIFSNDGDYVARLTHPSHRVLKHYVVETDRELSDGELANFMRGIRDDGELLRAAAAERLGVRKYRIVLDTGIKREIRRLVQSCSARVVRLKRVRIGDLELGALKPGEYRELTPKETALSLSVS